MKPANGQSETGALVQPKSVLDGLKFISDLVAQLTLQRELHAAEVLKSAVHKLCGSSAWLYVDGRAKQIVEREQVRQGR